MTIPVPRPGWHPSTWAEAVDDISAGRVGEHHYLELKREYGPAQNQEMAGDLASFANHGALLVVGVVEDKATGVARVAAPVVLQGFVERVEQVARRLDPPLNVESWALADPADPMRGIVFVRVPASEDAPHQANNRYYGRNERSTYKLSDAEVEGLMRRRRSRIDDLGGLLDRAPGFDKLRSKSVGRVAVVAVPTAGRSDELLAEQLAPAAFSTWTDGRMAAATAALESVVAADPVLGRVILGHWSPFKDTSGWSNPRTDKGVGRVSGILPEDSYAPMAWLGIDESGSANVAVDRLRLQLGDHPAQVWETFEWQTVVTSAAWLVMLVGEVCESVGLATPVDVGVRVEGIHGAWPTPPTSGKGETRRIPGDGRQPWQGQEYRAFAHVPYSAGAGVHLRQALHVLFGRLLRTTGLGDLLRLPA